jgi:hypothetical protein
VTQNETAGVDAPLFRAWIEEAVLSAFPDLSLEVGHRVLVCVDGGPGRMDQDTLKWAAEIGIDFFAKCPNTSSVSQEMDRLYAQLKRFMSDNANTIAAELKKMNKSPQLNKSHVPRILTGAPCQDFDDPLPRNPCGEALCAAAVCDAWLAVGAVPHTRAMLNDPSVRHELREGDPSAGGYADMNAMHLAAIAALNKLGLDSKPFAASIPVLPKPAVRNLTDDEKSLLISKTQLKAGHIFKAVGAVSYSSEVFLKGLRLRVEREAANKQLGVQKKADARSKVVQHTVRVLAADELVSGLKVEDLKAVLRYFKVLRKLT